MICVMLLDLIRVYLQMLFQVERLCDRVASSTLLEDRRDAVRALKSLSKVSDALHDVELKIYNALLISRSTLNLFVF